MLLSFGLIAGLNYDQAMVTSPGMIEDLYIYRQQYDDQQHGIQHKKQGCYDFDD